MSSVRPPRGWRPAPRAQPEAHVSELHSQVLAGDGAALDELARVLLHRLPQRLRRAFPRVERDLVLESIEDAILEYAARPSRFDASLGVPLERFLYLAAWRNLADLLRAEASRRVREARYASWELSRARSPAIDEAPSHEVDWRHVVSVISDERDRRALRCWLGGESGTRGLAMALGLSCLSSDEQRRGVKLFKDRIIKYLRRHFRRRSPSRP